MTVLGFRRTEIVDSHEHHPPVMIGGIPAGRAILWTSTILYHNRLDTIVVRPGRCDTIVVRLRKFRHIRINDGDDIEVWD